MEQLRDAYTTALTEAQRVGHTHLAELLEEYIDEISA